MAGGPDIPDDDRGAWVNIGALTPDPRNPNTHGRRSIDAIKASLREHGQRDPLHTWRGVVFAGNGRLEAMLELGWTRVWTRPLDDMGSYAQARRFALQHNRSAEFSEWDLDVLAEELGAQAEDGVDLSGIGWDDADMAFMLHDGQPDTGTDTGEGASDGHGQGVTCPACGHQWDPAVL